MIFSWKFYTEESKCIFLLFYWIILIKFFVYLIGNEGLTFVLVYLILYFVSIFETETSVEFSFAESVFWIKSSTGVANINKNTAATSNTPVPTSVCFSNWITGLTYMQKFTEATEN